MQTKTNVLDVLAIDAITHILSYCPISTVLSMSMTSKAYYAIIQGENDVSCAIWDQQYHTRFHLDQSHSQQRSTQYWKSLYIDSIQQWNSHIVPSYVTLSNHNLTIRNMHRRSSEDGIKWKVMASIARFSPGNLYTWHITLDHFSPNSIPVNSDCIIIGISNSIKSFVMYDPDESSDFRLSCGTGCISICYEQLMIPDLQNLQSGDTIGFKLYYGPIGTKTTLELYKNGKYLGLGIHNELLSKQTLTVLCCFMNDQQITIGNGVVN
jgi:hypothetical protein